MAEDMVAQNGPAYTMFLDQAAHLDWDWIRTFDQNYFYYRSGQGVDAILTQALANVAAGDGAYHYSICEMSYLRRFIEQHPDAVATFRQNQANIQIMSGGVTSPDCLVCASEGFIRNYLVGQTWLKSALDMVPQPHCWLPDDFGQGPELPAMLAALGFKSMGFMRLPGTLPSCARPQVENELVAGGPYFNWPASDGSSVIALWLIGGYGFGAALANGGYREIGTLASSFGQSQATPPAYSAAPAGLMYVPNGDDFEMPVPGLDAMIAQWNGSSEAAAANVAARAGSFADFIAAVIASGSAMPTRAYQGTPYWTGHYASRPGLKIHHYEAVRALVAAEAIALMTRPGDAAINNMLPRRFWSDLAGCWEDFAPSTHHDYINGTAIDAVYATEQLPLVRGVAARAAALRDVALTALAANMSYGDYGWLGPQDGVIVANPLGFARTGLAEVAGVAYWSFPQSNQPAAPTLSVSLDGGAAAPVQRAYEGGMLFLADAPSLGYTTGTLSAAAATTTAPAPAVLTETSDGFTLSNGLVSATVSATANWALSSLKDVAGASAELLAPNGGNLLLFYDEANHFAQQNDGSTKDVSGNLYQFGNEYADQGGTLPLDEDATIAISGPGLGALVLEQGPLRVRLRTTVMVTVGNGQQRLFMREYSLVAGEPFLRMTTEGAAPDGYSVMAGFAFRSPVAAISHGTNGHWTSAAPQPGFWGPPTFRATHDFVIPKDANGNRLAAVYHGGIPAWSEDGEGFLIGCLLRNMINGGQHGAAGTDPASHRQNYAIRVPTGLGGPETGQPLKEALGFSTPLVAAEVPPQAQNVSGTLPFQPASLASTDDAAAILTVAKPGAYDPTNLILRLYQPTNAARTVAVTLPMAPASASLVTATETAWPGTGSATATATATGVAVEMTGAIATVQVPGQGLAAG
jgi:alpha-mannosidase